MLAWYMASLAVLDLMIHLGKRRSQCPRQKLLVSRRPRTRRAPLRKKMIMSQSMIPTEIMMMMMKMQVKVTTRNPSPVRPVKLRKSPKRGLQRASPPRNQPARAGNVTRTAPRTPSRGV